MAALFTAWQSRQQRLQKMRLPVGYPYRSDQRSKMPTPTRLTSFIERQTSIPAYSIRIIEWRRCWLGLEGLLEPEPYKNIVLRKEERASLANSSLISPSLAIVKSKVDRRYIRLKYNRINIIAQLVYQRYCYREHSYFRNFILRTYSFNRLISKSATFPL